MNITHPKRRTVGETAVKNTRQASVKYIIPSDSGTIPVCAATFRKITGSYKFLK